MIKEILSDPMILVIIGIFGIVIAIPLLGFFLDYWPIFLTITVILILAWFGLQTIWKDHGKIQRGRINDAP